MTTDTIIAGGALALSLYGIYATSRHNRLSVTPFIFGMRCKVTDHHGLTIAYDIFNHGTGPAKITGFILLTKDKPLPEGKGDPIERWIRDHVGDKVKYQMKSHRNLGQNYSLMPGTSCRIIEAYFPGAKPSDLDQIEKTFDGLDIRIEYQSFYGLKFAFDTRTEKTSA